MNTFTTSFPSFINQEFQAKLEKLNKKLKRFKDANEIHIISTTSEYRSVFDEDMSKYIDVRFDVVTLEAPIATRFPGYRYVGSINFEGGVKTIFSIDDDINLTDDSIVLTRCDHCNTKRKRNSVHAFQHDDGSLKIIGNTCADQYVGLNIDKALHTFFNFLKDMEKETNYTNSMIWTFGIDSYIDCVRLAYQNNPKYRKADQYNFCNSTAFAVNYFHNMSFSSDYKTANMFKEKLDNCNTIQTSDIKDMLIKAYSNLDQHASNFNNNLVSALFYTNSDGSRVLRDVIVEKVRGIFNWAIYNLLNNNTQYANINSHIGTIGDTITVNGTVKTIKECINQYGASVLVILNTKEGEIKTFTRAKWAWNTAEGEKITLTGTIFNHDNWKGRKSTQIKRPVKA